MIVRVTTIPIELAYVHTLLQLNEQEEPKELSEGYYVSHKRFALDVWAQKLGLLLPGQGI